MAGFEQISRALRKAFAELEAARGTARRRALRKAHLLLLLADEMGVTAEAVDDSFVKFPLIAACGEDVSGGDVDAGVALPVFAEGAARYAVRGSCQGLQTVLVLRPHSDRARNRKFAPGSHAPRAQS